jgi:CrcB protein
MHKLIWLALAGSLGTLARYAVGTTVQRAFGGGIPWGTVAVNLLGCFLFGLVLTLARERSAISAATAEVVLVGFMGAFTTFSSYVNDLVGLGSAGRLGSAALDFTLQNAGGIGCFLAGAALARLG